MGLPLSRTPGPASASPISVILDEVARHASDAERPALERRVAELYLRAGHLDKGLFALRHLRLALDAGEPTRLVRGLGFAAMFIAGRGGRPLVRAPTPTSRPSSRMT